MRLRSANVAEERQATGISRRLCNRQAYAQDCIRAQYRFAWCAVQLNQARIHCTLLTRIHAQQRLRNLSIDICHRLAHALALVARLVSIAQLQRLVLAGGCAGRHRSAPVAAVFQHHFNLHGWIAARV